jgi:hypothetical protein
MFSKFEKPGNELAHQITDRLIHQLSICVEHLRGLRNQQLRAEPWTGAKGV